MSTWEATSSKRLETISNYEIVRRISSIYYEYQLMARKIDIHTHMPFSVLRAMGNVYPKLRQLVVGSIMVHAKRLERQSQEIIAEIEKELSKLS